MSRLAILRSCNLAVALLVLTAAAPAPAATAPVWLKVKSANFTIYTDGAQKDLLDFAVKYTAFQQAFRSLFVLPGKSLPPTVLVLFKRYSTFNEYLPSQPRSATTRILNYSIESDGMAFMALSLSDGRDTAFERTVEFETGWALRRIGYYLPLWAAQGAGLNLSTVHLGRGKCYFGEVPDDYARGFLLRNDGFPWPQFFGIFTASPEYNNNKDLRSYCGQACELMNWVLFRDDRTRERLELLSRKLRTTGPMAAAEEIMQAPATDFNRLIGEHLSRNSKAHEFPFDEAATRAGFTVETASEAEILVQTAAFLAPAGKPERCDEQLARAFMLEPSLRIVKEARARRAMDQHDGGEAVRLYREAIADGSVNYMAYLRSATTRLDDGSGGRQDRPGTGGNAAITAVEEIRRALELNRGSTDAYILLGRAFYLLPKVSTDLLDELAAGITPDEDSWQIRYYHGLLHERLGQPDQCLADFRTILAGPGLSDKTRDYVQSQLSHATYRMNAAKVKSLVENGQFDAARKIAADAEAEESNKGIADTYRKLGVWVQQRETGN
jgi:hypothetical protein